MPNKRVAAWATVLTAAGVACDEVTKLIDDIASEDDQQAKEKAAAAAEAKLAELMKEVNLLTEIEARTKEIPQIDIELVNPARAEYYVTAPDVIKDKKAAIDRWKALAKAMKTNIERLDERNKYLLDVIKQCDVLAKKIPALKKKVESFKQNDRGVCDTIECLQNLQLQKILDALPKLKKAAEEKQKACKKALDEEKRRYDTLTGNLKDLFGEKVE